MEKSIKELIAEAIFQSNSGVFLEGIPGKFSILNVGCAKFGEWVQQSLVTTL